MKTKFLIGSRVKYVRAGARFGQLATIGYVRKDGLLIIHFDGDPEDSILTVEPSHVRAI